MQERNVLILVVVLVVATAGAGVAVNAFRNANSSAFRAFDLSVDVRGTPTVGSDVQITITVRQAFIDARSLSNLFLSVDMGTLAVHGGTPSTNPWASPTVWNLTGLDLSGPRVYNITAAPTANGSATLDAMVWVPLGDLRSVSVDPSGHVNTADISLLATQSAPLTVGATG
ncbi:MAG TPA: hypothetical protein VEY12_09880 [Thermoplasmata archaeon]|nr:hypothetical protein [Thermoplasmata archaeon]